MIPKIIHYCWFGRGEKSEQVKHFIMSWKEILPDYEIQEWNEENFDYKKWKFCREAYAVKKYAFVADVCRFYALSKVGGIYLDTDIEVLKSFDSYLHHQSFIGEEHGKTIGSGCIGAERNTPWVREFLSSYDNKDFINYKGRLLDYANTIYLTKFLNKSKNGPSIYPMDYFCAKDYVTKELCVTENTICIHHYSATWIEKLTMIKRLKNLYTKLKVTID